MRSPTLAIDRYVIEVLLRDLVGHDKRPAAFLVYLRLLAHSVRQRGGPVPASLRDLADETGLSRSAVQAAMVILRRRKLVTTRLAHPTATAVHQVHRPWRDPRPTRRSILEAPRARTTAGSRKP